MEPERVDDYSSAPTAMWVGIAALACAMLGPCFCYLPYFLSLPLAIVAVTMGLQTLRDPDAAGSSRQMATAGLVSGGMVLALLLLIGLLLGLYVVFLVFTMVAS